MHFLGVVGRGLVERRSSPPHRGALVHPKVGLNEPMEQRPCRERLMPCPLWNRRTRVARLSRGSDRRGLPHGKEGGLRDYSCTHRDGEGKGRKIFQDPKHDHFSLIST